MAAEAMSKERAHPSKASMASPWPLDALPDVSTRFVLCTEDRFFPPDFLRRVVAERLGLVPDEIAASHCVALSHPKELADILRSCWMGLDFCVSDDTGTPSRRWRGTVGTGGSA
jgi:hypothetical protein